MPFLTTDDGVRPLVVGLESALVLVLLAIGLVRPPRDAPCGRLPARPVSDENKWSERW